MRLCKNLKKLIKVIYLAAQKNIALPQCQLQKTKRHAGSNFSTAKIRWLWWKLGISVWVLNSFHIEILFKNLMSSSSSKLKRLFNKNQAQFLRLTTCTCNQIFLQTMKKYLDLLSFWTNLKLWNLQTGRKVLTD